MHEHHCGCGCHDDHHEHPHHHHHEGGPLTENQRDFLHQLYHHKALPVARFLTESSREEDFSAVALSPVFLRSAADDMAAVKEAGAFLKGLEEAGMLTLDYDIPLTGYGYEEYKTSALYAYFEQTVRQGAAEHPEFLGDIPVLELGSMALTEAGENL